MNYLNLLPFRFVYSGLLVAALLVSASQARAVQNITDTAVSNAVTEHLFEDNAVGSYSIGVDTDNGVVTLTGQADNIIAKKRAVRIAESIRGVRAVIDRLKVVPDERSDIEIRDDVRDALLYDQATESFDVNVTVNDQVVKLTGEVESWQEKQLVEKVAGSVRGVRKIDNKVSVDFQTDRPDGEIRAEVRKTLRWDTMVDDALIDVSVNNGQVTLSGTVGSAAEKREATYDAWVAGVTEVDNSDLTVKRWARDEDLRKDKYVTRDADAIEAAVNAALLYDPRVSRTNISVSADNGVVTLTGDAQTLKARRAAAADARNVVGVWRVKNQIAVDAEQLTDSQIERNVKNALIRDPLVDRFDINVSVIDGQVYLTGDVDTYLEKSQADQVASSARGVSEVNNNLNVDEAFDVATYDPYVDEFYLYDYDWYTYPQVMTTTKNDWEIVEDIEDQMWWSPFVDLDEVTVAVADGVAELTGTVDTWAERQAATENAYEGGAIAVDNDLAVEYGPDYYSN